VSGWRNAPARSSVWHVDSSNSSCPELAELLSVRPRQYEDVGESQSVRNPGPDNCVTEVADSQKMRESQSVSSGNDRSHDLPPPPSVHLLCTGPVREV
jgi:hypothetical protein